MTAPLPPSFAGPASSAVLEKAPFQPSQVILYLLYLTELT